MGLRGQRRLRQVGGDAVSEYVGRTFKMNSGGTVKIIEEINEGTNYHAGLGGDGMWRYLRKSDFGRVTASNMDMSCELNISGEPLEIS